MVRLGVLDTRLLESPPVTVLTLDHAELKFHEVHVHIIFIRVGPQITKSYRFAHDTLTEFMAIQGFEVTKNYKSDVPSIEPPKFMTTAWRADYTYTPKNADTARSARAIGVNSEMDGLPIPKEQVTHACGHNLIAIAGVAIALAVKKALEVHDIAGSVTLLGTPG